MSTVIARPFGVFYALVENTYEDGNEAFLDGVQVLQCQLALVELAVQEYLLYDVLHVGLYPLGGRVLQGP